jgi:lytic murein transglycosylase B
MTTLPATARPGALPRERRDTLFLLLMCAVAIAPLLPHLPLWCGAFAAIVLGARAGLAWAERPLPRRWVVGALLALAVALTAWQEGTLLGRQAGVTLLTLLMALKTLELRNRRDAGVVFFLGCFLALSLFLYDQSPWAALAAVLSSTGLLTGLALAHMPGSRLPLRQAAAVAGRALLWGLPVTAALVLLFPRIGPLWSLADDATGRSGLAGSLRLGAVAELALDDGVALRVRFDGAPPPVSALYFRGPVLDRFDGSAWTNDGSAPPSPDAPPATLLPEDAQPLGPALPYTLVLEPGRLPVLPLPEATLGPLALQPAALVGAARRGSDLQWRTAQPPTAALRVTAIAHPQARHGTRAGAVALRDLVDLPPGHNPRTLEWAAAMRRDPRYAQADAATLVPAVLAHLQGGGYRYTLNPGPYRRHAIDEFWFDRRLGFCEHFTAAFVVVMRALDVPARVVTGYQGADPEPVDGWWTVRNHHAHAWAEVWQPGTGWLRVDPTAAVAPERVTQGRALRPEPGLLGRALQGLDPSWTAAWRRAGDSLRAAWNTWVVGYSMQQQSRLMNLFGIPHTDAATLTRALALLAAAAAFLGLCLLVWRRPAPGGWPALNRHIARRLGSVGIDVAPHHGPGERARRLRAASGTAGAAVAEVLERLEDARYAPGDAPGSPGAWRRRFDTAWRASAATLRRAAPDGSAPGTATGAGDAAGPGAGTAAGAGRALRSGVGGPWVLALLGVALALPGVPQAQGAAASPPASPAPAAGGSAARPDAKGTTPAGAPAARPDPKADRAAPSAGATPRGAGQAKPAEARKRAQKPRAQKAAPPRPTPVSTSPGTPYGRRDDVLQFAALLTQRHGLEPGWAEKHLAQAQLLPRVQQLIMPPPAGTARNWGAYRDRFIEPRRIAAGVAFWQEHAAWLELAEARWGVPASLVVGIIGVETMYGRHMGGFRALDALATLAFDFPPGRRDRSALFRDELEELFLLARREGVEPDQYRGSFAGALGLPQFLPSSIRRYAVDFDGDGRVDLLGNPADAIGSVANYLAAFGWQRDLPTHYPVAAPVDTADRAALLAPDIVPTFTAAQFAERGSALQGDGARHAGLLALVELQNGDAAPSYVAGTSNFYAVTRYNWSSYYALAVIELGRTVAKAMPLEAAR